MPGKPGSSLQVSMHQSSPQPPLPDFERPSEAVVFWMLEKLCGGAGGRFMLALPKLAQHVRLSLGTVKRAVASLSKRGLVRYRRGHNQYHPSIFEMPSAYADISGDKSSGEELSQEATARPRNARPIPSDRFCLSKEISIGDRNDGRVVNKHEENARSDETDRLACRIADGLGDLKNLRLYQSYCRRFPAEMILKAYVRAKEPTPAKIKVSRGALFNFLVQLYAKRGHK